MISATACLSVSAKTVFPVGPWLYEKINNDTEFEIDEYTGTSTELSTVYFHNNIPITSIGELAFLDNTTLTSITLSPYIHSIQSQAFLNVAQLETVVFNGDIKLIGSYAFAGCKALKNIALEDTQITSVAYSSFSNCDALEEVTLPTTVTSIKAEAFAYCDGLAKIVIPASVTAIHKDAFLKTPNVVIYCYENSAAHTFAVDNSIDYVLINDDPAETYIVGDTDGDGQVSVLDATAIQLLLIESPTIVDLDGRMAIRGDASLDTLLSIMDATEIQLWLLDNDMETFVGDIVEY